MKNWSKKLTLLRLLILVIQSKKTGYNTKINETEKKVTDNGHDKYFTNQEFNKLTSENFAANKRETKKLK